ncbi:MAG: TonB-dependent receptor [Pseudomonadota bacterium]
MRRFAFIGVGALLPLAALAQDPAPDTTDGAQEELLDTIIVRGEKIERSLQDTVTSVSVVTQQDIQDLNIVDIEDVLRRVGNAGFVATGSGTNEQFTLRGVSSQGVTAGTNTPVSTLYLDGAVIPNQAAGAAISNAWDVTQIEVLRGAQSTVQGRNSLIGALFVRTADPTYSWGGRARATYGTDGNWETSIAVGGPLVEDELAVRFTAQRLENDGFVRRLDGSNGDEESSTLLRGKLLWEPAGIPGLEWRLTATLSDEDDGSALVSAANPGDRIQITDVAADIERDLAVFSSELNYEINDQWIFTSLSSYADLETDEINDFDGLPALGLPIAPTRLDRRDEKDWLQEFRLQFDNGDNLRGLFGFLYAERQANAATQVSQVFPVPPLDLRLLGLDQVYLGALGIPTPPTVPSNLADPLLLGTFLPLTTDFTFAPKFDTLALFADVEFDLTDQWTVSAGFRYEQEDASFRGTQVNRLLEQSDILAVTSGNPGLAPAIAQGLGALGIPGPLADAAAGPIAGFYPAFAQGALAAAFGNPDPLGLVDISQEDDFDVFLPKFVARYEVNDDMSLAFSAQRAYRPGGLGINPVQSFIYSVDTEFAWNYELAFRSTWMDSRIVFNANLFLIDWEDQQLEVQLTPTPQDTVVLNVGESELWGLEAQLSARVTDSLQVFGTLGLLDTEITDDARMPGTIPTGNSLVGNEFAFAPDLTANVGFTYNPVGRFSATVDVNYQSDSQPLLPNFILGRENDSRTTVNARLGYDFTEFSVFLFGSNLLDEDYFVNAEAAGGAVVMGDPRVVGAGVTLSW